MLAFVLASATCYGAGWTDCWPSETHPRETVRQLAECYTSINERCVALGFTATAPVWYRSNLGNLVAMKHDLWQAIGLGEWISTNGTALSAAWLQANDKKDFPLLGNTTNLLRSLAMPTNYFEYTPYRCLNGLGPFTNDVSTLYPHGYSNSTTVAGGTTFPAGRACWYTTDYGWNRLKDIVAQLTHSRAAPQTVQSAKTYGEMDPSYYGTWSEAKSFAESYYGPVEFNLPHNGGGTIGYLYDVTDDPRYTATAFNSPRYFISRNLYTNTPSQTYYFLRAEKIPLAGTYTQSVFNAAGSLAEQDTYVLAMDDQTNRLGPSYLDGLFSKTADWGTTNIPAWCGEPTTAGPYSRNRLVQGWVQSTLYPVRAFRHWFFTYN